MSTKNRALLLDTNTLLLYLVGQVDVSLLSTFKRVDTFVASDLSLLARIMNGYTVLITTPHILAEVSNFVDQSPQHRRPEMQDALKEFIEQHAEIYEKAKALIQQREFVRVGIADTGLAVLSDVADVLTTDYQLAGLIQARGGNAMNFHHYRSAKFLKS